jgi:hypothetical protein
VGGASRRRVPYGWLIIIAIAGLAWWNNYRTEHPSRPARVPVVVAPAGAVSLSPYPAFSTSTHGGYENPAPGDDGTADCPPGGAPVYVGTNDPNNLDANGDGWGCQ